MDRDRIMLRSSSYLEQGTEQVKILWVLIHEYSASAKRPTTKGMGQRRKRIKKRDKTSYSAPFLHMISS